MATIDRDKVTRAFDFACERHADQKRYSGDEFITHPVGVAQICAGMRLDTETLCAALLHDTVEDTSATLEEVREEFGEEIAALVDGVTKLTSMDFESRDERQAENYRKMMVAMATDVRVILIKLADRLHNMRTLGALPKQKQTLKSHETLEIYAPLAHRLGIHAIKWELEDLAFATLHPRKYAEIKQLVAQQRDERETYVTEAGAFLAEELEEVGIDAEISGRAKHFYSIYTKMAKKGREFNEIFDLTAMRVIVGSVKDCYGAIGVIHSLWKPLPGRFKDFVAMPKANMYQALHTTVIGPEGKPLEIQIRTEEMHKLAEYGIAAHVAYKEGGRGDPQREKMTWLRQLVEAEGEQDPAEFLESLKVDLFEDEVFVFTPKGEVKNLSAGSTPLDFAYAVHTDVGHSCVGAKVNGAIVPLHYQLRSGDIVEVLTAKQKRAPSLDWLKLVRTSRARNKIRAWFKEERREDAERDGREGLEEALKQARRADAEDRRLGAARRRDPRDGLPQSERVLHRPRPGQSLDQDRRQQNPAAAENRRGGRRRRPAAGDRALRPRPPHQGRLQLRDRGEGRRGRRGAARQVLPAGPRRRDRGLRQPRPRDHHPPHRLQEREGAETGAGALRRRRLGGRQRGLLPGRNRDRRLRSHPPARGPLADVLGGRASTSSAPPARPTTPMVKNKFVVEVGDTEQLKHCISRLRNVESVFDAYRITPTALRPSRMAP